MGILAENLKSLRVRAGMSIRKLEELSGVSKSVISAIESGKNINPRLETLSNLANALGVSVETLTDMEVEHEYVITDVEEAMNIVLNQDNLMLHGEALTDEAKVQLANSIKMALQFAAEINKRSKK